VVVRETDDDGRDAIKGRAEGKWGRDGDAEFGSRGVDRGKGRVTKKNLLPKKTPLTTLRDHTVEIRDGARSSAPSCVGSVRRFDFVLPKKKLFPPNLVWTARIYERREGRW